jgi:hypothetical protein
VKVHYTVEGRAEAKKEIRWWRENRRDNPEKAYRELLDVIELIKKAPTVHKPYGRLADELVWRRPTATTRLHVHYTVDDEQDVAFIEFVWGAHRGAAPSR